MRITVQAILLLTGVLAFNASAQQAYPTKPMRILVGVPPGGGIDAITRIVIKQVSETNKAFVFVIENLPGANGALAINRAANATPDGYTLAGSSDSTIVSQVFKRYEQDIRKTLAPVVLMTVQPTMLFVTASLPVNSVRELVAYAKQNPGKVSFGSTGIGSNYHLGLLRFQEMAGVDMALQGAAIDTDVLGRGRAAINDGGDQALEARLVGRTLAGTLTRFHLKFLNLRHFPDPSVPG